MLLSVHTYVSGVILRLCSYIRSKSYRFKYHFITMPYPHYFIIARRRLLARSLDPTVAFSRAATLLDHGAVSISHGNNMVLLGITGVTCWHVYGV